MAASMIQLSTFFLETSTDNNGFFSISHGLEVIMPPPPFRGSIWVIEGIVVSVQHQNNNWHTLEISNAVDNRFWWNQTVIQGLIASPNFRNRPVKIVIFAFFQPI